MKIYSVLLDLPVTGDVKNHVFSWSRNTLVKILKKKRDLQSIRVPSDYFDGNHLLENSSITELQKFWSRIVGSQKNPCNEISYINTLKSFPSVYIIYFFVV